LGTLFECGEHLRKFGSTRSLFNKTEETKMTSRLAEFSQTHLKLSDEAEQQELTDLQIQLDDVNIQKSTAAFIRCKKRWQEKEHHSKYFFNWL